MINSELFIQSLPALLHGTIISLEIAFFSCLIGMIGGTILGFIQTSNSWWLSSLVTLYTTVIRGTPMLFQIIVFVYLIPLPLSNLQAAILAIGINSSAYVCEIVKSGILSVGSGQLEAAHVFGLTPWQTNRYIIFPQAIRVILPAIGNEFITLIKDSSLASVVGVTELFKEGSIIISHHYDAITIYAAIGVIYLSLTSIVAFILHLIQKRVTYVKH